MIKDMCASVVGATACVYTGQPFDTIKVRMQVRPGEFRHALQCMHLTVSSEGVLALWRGSLPAVTGALAENAVGFAINGELQRVFVHVESDLKPFLMGFITGTCTAFVLCPSEVVKVRAQMSRLRGRDKSIEEIIRQTFRKQGLGGFYTGIHAQCLRDGPFYMSFFGTYQTLRGALRRRFPLWPDSYVYILSGGIAGQVAWIVATPADVIKSIVQTSSTKVTVLATAEKILREQGLRGFCNGMQVALVRAFPANAALFMGYEFTRKIIS